MISMNRSDGLVYLIGLSNENRCASVIDVYDVVRDNPYYSLKSIIDNCSRLSSKTGKSTSKWHCDCIVCLPQQTVSSFSPDSRFLLCPTYPNGLICYDVQNRQTVGNFATLGRVRMSLFHPKLALVITSNRHLSFWAPGSKPSALIDENLKSMIKRSGDVSPSRFNKSIVKERQTETVPQYNEKQMIAIEGKRKSKEIECLGSVLSPIVEEDAS
ncbi:hypothetical protein ACOME3_004286 [Neoechinorhynchus agilis]